MLSSEDVKKFIQNTRQELEEEKKKLGNKNVDYNEDTNIYSYKDCVGSPRRHLHSARASLGQGQKKASVRCVKRSVSASPLRSTRDKDYTQELQIQIYPSDLEEDSRLEYESAGAGLLETVSASCSGDDVGSLRQDITDPANTKPSADDIRKYCLTKLGSMLRTGEFSPNHPEMGLGGALPRDRGDVFVGLGLYEEKRRELMAKRKKEYREYLAKQKSLNALAKQKERVALEQNTNVYDRGGYMERSHLQSFLSPAARWTDNRPRRPSSIAVQTDDDLILLNQNQSNNNYLTQAERELSPRPSYNSKVPSQAVQIPVSRVAPDSLQGNGGDWRMLVEKVNIGTQNNLIMPPGQRPDVEGKFLSPSRDYAEQRDYFDNVDGMNSKVLFGKDSPRARLLQDLKHTYMPSLFDEEAIKQRNMDSEKEAVAKRVTYQQELKKQIDEQHRLREERKLREKMLEEAETKRLEEQLKILKLAHEAETEKQKQMAIRIKKDSNELERQRLKLQTEIDNEKKALRQAKMKQNNNNNNNETNNFIKTSRSDSLPISNKESSALNKPSNLPFYYSTSPNDESPDIDTEIMSYNLRRNNPYLGQDPPPKRVPFSTNVPDSSVFAESIPVKNYNTNDFKVLPDYELQNEPPAKLMYAEPKKFKPNDVKIANNNRNNWTNRNKKQNYEPTFLNKSITEMIDTRNIIKNSPSNKGREVEDTLPIPVLREPERDKLNNEVTKDVNSKYSDAMKQTDDKWKVPIVQKNILKSNVTEDGTQQNILTQLGSIRRQLQLEQLKLDQSQLLPTRLVK